MYQELATRVEYLEEIMKTNQKSSALSIMDNQQFIQLMNISKRTAQNWRNEGLIAYSEVGGKIYYKYADVLELLEGGYIKPSRP